MHDKKYRKDEPSFIQNIITVEECHKLKEGIFCKCIFYQEMSTIRTNTSLSCNYIHYYKGNKTHNFLLFTNEISYNIVVRGKKVICPCFTRKGERWRHIYDKL